MWLVSLSLVSQDFHIYILLHIVHTSFLNTTGATATYIRFLPYLKNNYDYGVVTFVLTFNLIAVSSYRVDSALKIARDRFYAIAIGCAVCLIMSALVFPYWSGEDLHNSIVNRLEGLAEAVEGIYANSDHLRICRILLWILGLSILLLSNN